MHKLADKFQLDFRFIIVHLKLNGAFWANCTIFYKSLKKIKINISKRKIGKQVRFFALNR